MFENIILKNTKNTKKIQLLLGKNNVGGSKEFDLMNYYYLLTN